MNKITDARILNAINSVRDKEVKNLLLQGEEGNCTWEFMNRHKRAFRALLPTYFDELVADDNGYYGNSICAWHSELMAYLCMETGVVDTNDFRTVKNFAVVGISASSVESCAPSVKHFRSGIEKLKDGDKKLIDFLDKNPEYLEYFLPLMCSFDSEVFSEKLSAYIKSSGLEDSLRYFIFKDMMQSTDAKMLLRCLDEIDKNNYYRFKALGEAAVSIGDYTIVLSPKEFVRVLRDAALGNCEIYFDTDFKQTYHFIKTYNRVHEKEFRVFACELLRRGGERARWAFLYSLSFETINKEYALDIFSGNLTFEELSFFIRKIDSKKLDMSVIPTVFEKLYGMFIVMDKVCYKYKTDDDVTFAREVPKSNIAALLGELAVRADNAEYIKRLDGCYDTLKEEAQAEYLRAVGKKTKLDTRLCAVKFLKTDNYTALKYFDSKKIKLTYDEAVSVSDYLKTKKESVKTKIIKEYLGSDDCDKIIKYLITSKEDFKKSVGEELINSRGKVDKLKLAKKTGRFFWESESVFAEEKKPRGEIEKLAKQKSSVKPIKPIKFKRVKEFFDKITDFIREHRDYEYASEYGEGLAHFGSMFERIKGSESGRDDFGAYPLGAELKALISGYSQEEIAGILILTHCVESGNKKLYAAMCVNKYLSNFLAAASGNEVLGFADKSFDYLDSMGEGCFRYNANAYCIVCSLQRAIIKELLSEETVLRILASFTQKNALAAYYKKGEKKSSFRGDYPGVFINALEKSEKKDTIKELTHFESALVNIGATENFETDLVIGAYEYGFISAALTRYFLLENGGWSAFYEPSSPDYIFRDDYKFPKFKALLTEYVESAIEREFARGSLQTQFSSVLRYTGRFFGVDKFIKAIVALRGLTWVRSPYGCAKNETLSYILKNTVKSETDTYEKFTELVNSYDITDDELMRATLFNPEFVDFTAKYLDIPNLKLAVFWFVAHLNEFLYGDKQERRTEQIKEFSDIDYEDFKDGAFDYKWYAEMVANVDAYTLKRIYDDAKYVTVGGLHKRAQRFFDAVNGRISKSECLEKIHSTRNKDYCLIYSLIPVENKEDLYERYAVLAEFARTSKQFGAQRQLSERRTVDIAFENLARSAGYANADIFMFEMESQTPSDIYKPYTVGDIIITPYIDEQKFKVSYKVSKDGKELSALPSKYSKNDIVAELREQIKLLNQKLRRIIASFESCMNACVPFTVNQLAGMSREPIIAFVLSKLVLISDGKLCVFDGEPKDICGNAVNDGEVYIAHPVSLKKSGLLTEAIEHVVKNNIRQPFKQVLREIYTKTDSELTQDEVLRFKGFEVDLRKCVAALKGKGWGVSEDIGLRKVYYRTDIVSAIFRKCDFLYTVDFENVNRELHGIFFLKRKSGEIMPIKDVDDITFSETLRDVDLMVSISSKVIYDFELAMSTVEVRHEVLKSIVGILSLTNVSFLKDNIKVEGNYGTYVINIRTGLVFKEGSGNLALDTVYSVDKPIPLDFIDEDPMTADIISKAVVLANDAAVKDPSILREIKS